MKATVDKYMSQGYKRQRKFPYIIGLGWVAIAMLTTGCEELIEYLPPLPSRELLAPQPPQPLLPTQSSKVADMEAAVRQGINQVRQKNGLSPLKHNDKLAQIARNYSRQMAQKKFFSHTGADGSSLPDRVSAGGITYWMVGENLFTCTNVPRPVPASIEGWMNSPGHRANVLRSVFRETGVGIWRVGNTYYMTQLFMRR